MSGFGSFGGGGAGFSAAAAGTATNTGSTTGAAGFGNFGVGGNKAGGTGTTAGFGGGFGMGGTGSTFGSGGGTTSNFGSGSAFGSTTGGFGTGGFGTTGMGTNAGNNAGGAAMATTPTNIFQRLQAVASALDPTSPSTNQFKYAFFNRLPNPGDVKRVQTPAYIDANVQRQAIIHNPDPESMVPVWAIGFHDLKRRADEQDKMTDEHAKRLENAALFIQDLQRRLQNSQQKMSAIRDKMAQQAHKHLHMAATIEVLRSRGIPIQPEEDAWRVRLQAIYSELQKPNEFRGRLNEIQSKARMLSDGRGPMHLAAMLSAASNTLSEADLEAIATFLDDQRRGIAQLTNLVKNDLANLELLFRLISDPNSAPLS
eukprot:TRINITY_DN453_c1_g1_i3.p1 TRINITY_DN453_c1_g1~~TRINITY_DN453_c1_g1_i3.p1  ORF type:complete len:379 (-),score=89.34 TRINITY_DN453_c1_g1_i3:1079-2188(-)